MALIFETKDPASGYSVLGFAEQTGDDAESMRVRKATADLSLSNVVSVAKNDQPYNPINLNRKEKGTYERIW